MAANVLTIGSKFNPLSFDEMAKPLIMYKQEADKLEEEINKYEELCNEADAYKQKIKELNMKNKEMLQAA